ncbi:MAG: dihydrolipoamide succinyltransferase, partial [Rhodospirillaceae bacterium]|nr:dihydrolipoamide succinyltransferase [Rhodospirillaceae bacterium]
MTVQITVPQLGESITEATVATWFKKKGESVTRDEPLVELETDKVTMEVFAPATGVLADVMFDEGADVEVGAVLGMVEEGAAAAATPAPAEAAPAPEPAPAAAPAAEPVPGNEAPISPAVRRILDEHGLDAGQITGSGKDGRLVKGDVQAFLDAGGASAP